MKTIKRTGMQAIKMGKYLAMDGHPCKSQEEMDARNKEVEKLFVRDDARRLFGKLQEVEKSEWFTVNIAQKVIEHLLVL